ncbi:hypothetical protein CLOM_g1130 [Closterium sp. NIES-68]|nr:hypothetical protein CLOM_g1130 [Closterium sp. NIES-68]GJP62080.1 hypothetical protein CLOP_g19181 [Closterium sp. NIES-67]GJP65228.1 hypothetical protein CLOP_g22140 [Closterium sp. NIES-67]
MATRRGRSATADESSTPTKSSVDQVEEVAATPETEAILIKIVSDKGEEVQYKVKKGAKMQKVFDTYEKKVGAPPGSLRFTFHGERAQGKDTVEVIGLKQNSVLEAHQFQLAG